jgi:hypothetical protein
MRSEERGSRGRLAGIVPAAGLLPAVRAGCGGGRSEERESRGRLARVVPAGFLLPNPPLRVALLALSTSVRGPLGWHCWLCPPVSGAPRYDEALPTRTGSGLAKQP